MANIIKYAKDLQPGDIIVGLGECVSVLLVPRRNFLGRIKATDVIIEYFIVNKIEGKVQVLPLPKTLDGDAKVAIKNDN